MSSQGFPDHLRALVDHERWTFAKTMPEWPHEYLVRERVDERLFEDLVRHIRGHGREGRFYAKRLIYFEEDGMTYWTMGAPIEETTIINRCRSEDTYERRLERGVPELECFSGHLRLPLAGDEKRTTTPLWVP